MKHAIKTIWIFFKLLLKELISPLNYFMALLIGLVINYFQGIGIFSSLVPFIVPIIVQSISKASVKFGNRNINLLVRLPMEKKDPAFVINTNGDIIASEGKTKDFFMNNNIYNLHDLFKNKDLEIIKKIITKSCETKKYISDKWYSPRAEKWYLINIKADKFSDNLLVWLDDITEIVKTQYENEKLSTAVSQTSNSIIITDIKGDIEFVNNAFELYSGYKREEIIGKNPRILKTNYLSKEVYRKMWDTISSGNVWKGEFNNRHKNKSTYWEEATISPIKDINGKIQNYIAVKENITERKKAKEEADSMALFAQLNPEPVFRFDKDGIILQSNPVANDIFQLESIVHKQIKELVPEISDINFKQFIEQNSLLTITSEIGDKIMRFILRGLNHLNICQIYGSDITERVKAQEKIEEQKQSITDSIQYASRIQKAILPAQDVMNNYFEDHFIYFKPRDIVSGDFYWMTEKNNKLILIAADSTGHGVPGAFMSMLGVSFLNEIVNKNTFKKASTILDELRKLVKSTLAQSGKSTDDGMDIALVIIDKKEMKINYSGAYNPLYIIRNNDLLITKADRMPIGNYIIDDKAFTNHEIDIKKGDSLYIFSDGYPDQFGGEKNSKFSTRAFKKLITEISKYTAKEQSELLEQNFQAWKGDQKQIDDVLIIGAKI